MDKVTRDLDRDLVRALFFARALARDSALVVKLEQLRTELSSQYFWKRWDAEGQLWLEQLCQAMIELRNMGWQFNEQQKQQLQAYYDANKFLVQLMQIQGAVSQEVRAEIEDSLLLPWDELQRRYPEVYGDS